ncbi:MAG: hypothetical protein K2G60_06335 [Oscillospiraceae bacterium]|nr:hypothetical protein [Oscillospiraceae bacterium]
MTENELNSLYYISQRIRKLKQRIAELNSEIGIGSGAMNGMPHGTGIGNPVENLIIKKCDLCDKLNAELLLKIEEEQKIRSYISSAKDEEVKLIMEMRFIHLMKWQDISAELNIDRTTASKKMRNYLKIH